MQNPDLRSTWFASAVKKHSAVVEATALPDGLVRIERRDEIAWEDGSEPREIPPISVAPLGNLRIDKQIVEATLVKSMPTVILLVPKLGHYDWDARELAMASGSTVLTFKELYVCMGVIDPRPCVDGNVSYNRERLEQHSRVAECRMICESSFQLRRKGSLGDVVVAVEYEYEFSEEAAVRAIGRHPAADVILNANPIGRSTTAAYLHARDAQVPIYRLGELMGALNYDGDQFRSYEPPERR
jgi:hypothetical protein